MFPTLGLWVRSAGGLRAVALPDQPVPGEPGGTVFHSIQSVNGFNTDGFLLFPAILPASGGLSSTALLFADPASQISTLARTGSTLTIAPGDVRTVTQVFARRSALSSDAHAAFAV